jgi:hypothetical protein
MNNSHRQRRVVNLRQNGASQPAQPADATSEENGAQTQQTRAESVSFADAGPAPQQKPLVETRPLPSSFQTSNAQNNDAPHGNGKKKSGNGKTNALLGCCIFLLLIFIALAGLAAYFAKQAIDIFKEKSGQDIIQYLDQRFGDTVEERFQDSIEQGLEQGEGAVKNELNKRIDKEVENIQEEQQGQLLNRAEEELEKVKGNFNVIRR